MSKYKIENNALFQDGVDVSDTPVAELEETAKTLMSYAKFKAAVEKAATTCFGDQGKKKTTKKKSSTPVTATQAKPTPAVTNVATTTEVEGGRTVNTETGELIETNEVF